jgi:hypothetical protein
MWFATGLREIDVRTADGQGSALHQSVNHRSYDLCPAWRQAIETEKLGHGSGQSVALVAELVLHLVENGKRNLLGCDLRQGTRDTVAREPEHSSWVARQAKEPVTFMREASAADRDLDSPIDVTLDVRAGAVYAIQLLKALEYDLLVYRAFGLDDSDELTEELAGSLAFQQDVATSGPSLLPVRLAWRETALDWHCTGWVASSARGVVHARREYDRRSRSCWTGIVAWRFESLLDRAK